MHENWKKIGIVDKLKQLASRRRLEDLTVGPILSVTNDRFLKHIESLLRIPGASLAFGGDLLEDHSIPSVRFYHSIFVSLNCRCIIHAAEKYDVF